MDSGIGFWYEQWEYSAEDTLHLKILILLKATLVHSSRPTELVKKKKKKERARAFLELLRCSVDDLISVMSVAERISSFLGSSQEYHCWLYWWCSVYVFESPKHKRIFFMLQSSEIKTKINLWFSHFWCFLECLSETLNICYSQVDRITDVFHASFKSLKSFTPTFNIQYVKEKIQH